MELSGEFLLLAILVLPALIALTLYMMTHTTTLLRTKYISTQYWGAYSGSAQSRPQMTNTIKLYRPVKDENAPTSLPQHAVSWHP